MRLGAQLRHSLASFVNGELVTGERRLHTDDVLGLAGVLDLLLFIDPRQAPAPEQPIEPLTSRERAVLELLAANTSYLAIADSLCISTNTVKSHIKRLLGKLGVAKAAAAINIAHQRRLI